MRPRRTDYINKRTLGISKISVISSNKQNFKYQLCYGHLYDEDFYDCTVCDDRDKCRNLSETK